MTSSIAQVTLTELPPAGASQTPSQELPRFHTTINRLMTNCSSPTKQLIAPGKHKSKF